MQCHVIILDTVVTTYTFYEINITKGTDKKTNRKNKEKQIEREEGIMKEKPAVPLLRRCGRHLKITS